MSTFRQPTDVRKELMSKEPFWLTLFQGAIYYHSRVSAEYCSSPSMLAHTG
uniref:Uncharacterized protein n=1 Tax=Anguilla anguilla TaxID=7936 RepID=A0A0E9VTX6_ANGAN